MIFKAKIVNPGMLGLTKTDLRTAGREGIGAAGDYWHRHYKKHHFQKYAFAKYAYKRRSKSYERRKQREHPEANGRPLVWSGESERRAMASETVHAKAKSFEAFRAECIVDAPALNYKQLHDEMVRVTVHEERALAREFGTVYERWVGIAAAKKTQPIRLVG